MNKLYRNGLVSCVVGVLVLILFVAAPAVSGRYEFLRGDEWSIAWTGLLVVLVVVIVYLFSSSVAEIWRVLNKDRPWIRRQ